jgi:hypothetical protein
MDTKYSLLSFKTHFAHHGWSIEEIDRGYITNQIKSVRGELGVKREELGR